MPNLVYISHKELMNSFTEAPEGFRFAKVDDFHNNGVRKELVEIYVLYQDRKNGVLEQAFFNKNTSRNWLQYMLNYQRVFIKTGEPEIVTSTLTYHLSISEEYLKQNI